MTEKISIEIENLKCGGCETSILKGIEAIPGVSDVKVDHSLQSVQFSADPSLRASVAEKLRSMGYPEKGTVSGLTAGLTNAKSYISCAVGRFG